MTARAISGQPMRILRTVDSTVDAWWERNLRGRRLADRVAYSLSEAANHSIIWHALGSVQAVTRRDRRRALRLSSALGAEALVVTAVKFAVGRDRPRHAGARPHALREPLTSSFPSGHASAAMVAASMLGRDSRWSSGWYALALGVALSRVHVRMHHASDVAAGIAVGAAMGWTARRMLR